MRPNTVCLRLILVIVAGLIATSVMVMAQTTGPIARFTATTSNVSGAGDAVRFEILKWSTDAERDQFLNAWTHPNPPPPPPTVAAAPPAGAAGAAPAAPAAGGARGGAAGGRGGGAGAARGGGAPPPAAAAGDAPPPAAAAAAGGGRGGGAGRGAAGAAPPLPAAAAADAPPAAAAAAGGGRGGGGRGGGGGGAAADATPETPEGALLAAIQKVPSVGILWTSESAGYSLKFAYRIVQPDGSERIIFITDRRLGTFSDQWWKPTGTGTPSNLGFTMIEFRLNDKGEGEGRTSLTGKVTEDPAAKSVALDNYSAQPVVFKGVKKVR